MNIKEKVYIWLSMSDLPVKKLYDFALSYDNLEDLWNLDSYDSHAMQYLDGKEFQELITLRDNGAFEKTINDLEHTKINFITPESEDYPECFLNLDVSPLIIYYVGDIKLLKTRALAVVGSRVCTRYGAEQTQRFAAEISKAGFSIVSGLADGIDGNAHKGALSAGGKCIGVLAGGLKKIFPAINVQLARDVVKSGGVVISEKAPNSVAKSYTFVQRNRLIAAVSEGVLVTEAGAKSGALHTVNFALDLGKEIFALPGNVNSSASVGTNTLIKQFYSCCVTEPREVIDVLNRNYIEKQSDILSKPKVDIAFTLKPEEKAILDFLDNEEKHFDEISENLQIDLKKLPGLLTTMEIRGLIEKLPSNFYTKKGRN